MNKAVGYVNSLPRVIPIHTYTLPNQGFNGSYHQNQLLNPGQVPQMYQGQVPQMFPGQLMNGQASNIHAGGLMNPGTYGYPMIHPQTMLMPVPNINDFLKSNTKTESDVSSSLNSGNI